MLDPQQLFSAVVAVSALFASMAWCLARPNWLSMLSTVALAVLWPFVDRPLTGRLLMVLSDNKGVTQSDLISALAVVIVAVQAVRLLTKAQRRRRAQTGAAATAETPEATTVTGPAG